MSVKPGPSVFLHCSPLCQPEEGRTVMKTHTGLDTFQFWKGRITNVYSFSSWHMCINMSLLMYNIQISNAKYKYKYTNPQPAETRECVRELNEWGCVLAHNAVCWWDINRQGMCSKMIKDLVYAVHLSEQIIWCIRAYRLKYSLGFVVQEYLSVCVLLVCSIGASQTGSAGRAGL